MSYVVQPKAANRLVRRAAKNRARKAPVMQAMGDLTSWLEDLISPGPALLASEIAPSCGVDASAVATWFAQIGNVGTTWNPTGTYAIADMNSVVTQVMAMINQASLYMTSVAAVNNSDQLQSTTNDLATQYTYGVNYQAQVTAAAGSGATVMNAPQLKQWVVDSMVASLNGTVAAGAAACDATTWQVYWAAYQPALQTAITVVTAVVGVIASAADKVVALVGGAFSLATWLEQYGLWVGAGLLGLWLYTQKKPSASSRR